MACKVLCEISETKPIVCPGLIEKILSVVFLCKNNENLYLLLESLSKIVKTIETPETLETLIKTLIEIIKNKQFQTNQVSSIELIKDIPTKDLSTITIQELLTLGFILMSEIDYYNDLEG